MKSQIIVAYAAQTCRRVKRPQMRQSKPALLTLTLIQEICHLQRLTNTKQQYVSIDTATLNCLTSCVNGRSLLWVVARLCCSHYALCMCGLLGIFSSLRWTVRWWVQTCFLKGDVSLLVAARKTLDMWSGRHISGHYGCCQSESENTVYVGVLRLLFKTLEEKSKLYFVVYYYLTLKK